MTRKCEVCQKRIEDVSDTAYVESDTVVAHKECVYAYGMDLLRHARWMRWIRWDGSAASEWVANAESDTEKLPEPARWGHKRLVRGLLVMLERAETHCACGDTTNTSDHADDCPRGLAIRVRKGEFL
jgi:hypothetical protein